MTHSTEQSNQNTGIKSSDGSTVNQQLKNNTKSNINSLTKDKGSTSISEDKNKKDVSKISKDSSTQLKESTPPTKLSASERPYKSRKQRPCDLCRKRKTRCIILGSGPCQLCKKLNGNCEFTDKVPPINRHKKSDQIQSNTDKQKDPETSVKRRKKNETDIEITDVNKNQKIISNISETNNNNKEDIDKQERDYDDEDDEDDEEDEEEGIQSGDQDVDSTMSSNKINIEDFNKIDRNLMNENFLTQQNGLLNSLSFDQLANSNPQNELLFSQVSPKLIPALQNDSHGKSFDYNSLDQFISFEVQKYQDEYESLSLNDSNIVLKKDGDKRDLNLANSSGSKLSPQQSDKSISNVAVQSESPSSSLSPNFSSLSNLRSVSPSIILGRGENTESISNSNKNSNNTFTQKNVNSNNSNNNNNNNNSSNSFITTHSRMPIIKEMWRQIYSDNTKSVPLHFNSNNDNKVRKLRPNGKSLTTLDESFFINGNSYIDPYVNLNSKISFDRQRTLNYTKTQINNGKDEILIFENPTSSSYDDIIKTRLQKIVNNEGQKLVSLFFKYINPRFPLISKSYFDKHFNQTNQHTIDQSVDKIDKALLLSVYCIGLDWWCYDLDLTLVPSPTGRELYDLAITAISENLDNPTYNILQAGIMLTQKKYMSPKDFDSRTWILLGMCYSMCQNLGINIDCTDWDIDEYEKRLRRKIWWSLFMQEKWFSIQYGRSSHININDWNVSMIEASDFKDDLNTVTKSTIEGFQAMCKLTIIIDEIATNLLSLRSKTKFKNNFKCLYFNIKNYYQKILELENSFPEYLQIQHDEGLNFIDANGTLKLAIITAKVILLRTLVHGALDCRKLKDENEKSMGKGENESNINTDGVETSRSDSTESQKQIEDEELIRDSIKWSFEIGHESIKSICSMRPSHFGGYWHSWTRLNFATVAYYYLLLSQIASTKEEIILSNEFMIKYKTFVNFKCRTFSLLELSHSIINSLYDSTIQHRNNQLDRLKHQ
ncbi:hypothetical protein B5S29_g3005 [[Candida] boidinii]|nr:hypothetical protein B5S29_g3005 [[Candida] boidinii]